MSTQRTQPGRKKALVLGEDTRSFLSVIRSLGRAGIEVHIAGHDGPASEGAIAARSRYVAAQHSLPAYDQRPREWVYALAALMRREKFDLVLPTHDPSLIPMQKHREVLEPFGKIYLLEDEVYETVFDKFRMNALARSVGVNTPREMLITELEGAQAVRASFQLPVVLKPRRSFRESNLAVRNCVKKAYSWDEFEDLLGPLLAAGPIAVQENFVGVGVGVELLLLAGEPQMVFQHVRLHEPLHGGGSSYRQGVAVEGHLRDAALRLLQPLRYTGVAMVEFKVNPRTGEWVFLEVNGRFWGSLPLALASGADFPRALFELLVDGRTKFDSSFDSSYRRELCCRHWAYDFNWQIANLRADSSDPTLSAMPLRRVIGETLINLVTLRERSDTFVPDDPMPAFEEVRGLTRHLAAAVYTKLLPHALRLPGARLQRQRRARRAFRKARSVLFVCKGNICRSPFAAAVASAATDKAAASAGFLGPEQRPSPENAVMAAAELDVDLSAHRSQLISESLVGEADILFVFDRVNYAEVVERYPRAKSKVFFLSALCPDLPPFIADPWGSEVQDYVATYRQILRALTP